MKESDFAHYLDCYTRVFRGEYTLLRPADANPHFEQVWKKLEGDSSVVQNYIVLARQGDRIANGSSCCGIMFYSTKLDIAKTINSPAGFALLRSAFRSEPELMFLLCQREPYREAMLNALAANKKWTHHEVMNLLPDQ